MDFRNIRNIHNAAQDALAHTKQSAPTTTLTLPLFVFMFSVNL